MIGYWMFSSDVDKVNVGELKVKGVTDVFVVTRSATGSVFKDIVKVKV